MLAQTKQNHQVGREDQKPTFRCLAEDDEEEQASEGLNHLVQRNAGGSQYSWKKVTVVVDSRAAEKRNADEHVHRTTFRGNGKIEEWENGKIDGAHQEQRTSVRTFDGFVRNSTWQVADVSHIIEAGNVVLSLFQ